MPSSSELIVAWPMPSARVTFTGLDRETVNVSGFSGSESFRIVTGMLATYSPGWNVRTPLALVKSLVNDRGPSRAQYRSDQDRATRREDPDTLQSDDVTSRKTLAFSSAARAGDDQ